MVPHFSMRLELPHISRFFSATILWVLFFALLSVNMFAAINYPRAYSNKLSSVFAHPFLWEPHAALAVELWSLGGRDWAINEATLAQELYAQTAQQSPVLGLTTDPNDLLNVWKNAPIQEEKQMHYWEKIIQTRPDYRDGYIELASLWYARGRLDKAKSYVLTAQTIDPNSTLVAEILTLLSKNNK